MIIKSIVIILGMCAGLLFGAKADAHLPLGFDTSMSPWTYPTKQQRTEWSKEAASIRACTAKGWVVTFDAKNHPTCNAPKLKVKK